MSVSFFTKWMGVSYLIALAGLAWPGNLSELEPFHRAQILASSADPLSGAPPAQITHSHIMAPVYLLSNLPIFHFSPGPLLLLLLVLSRSTYQRGKSINLPHVGPTLSGGLLE